MHVESEVNNNNKEQYLSKQHTQLTAWARRQCWAFTEENAKTKIFNYL